MINKRLPAQAFWILVGVMVVLLTLHLTLQHLNLSYDEKHGQIFELSNRFDVDDEASVPTWFSQAIWLGIAAMSMFAARLAANKPTRSLWVIMAGIGLVFSIDEVSGLHELSLQSLHLLFFGLEASTSLLNAWWLVLPFVLLFGIWFLGKLHKVLRAKQWLLMMAGWMVFLAGAVGVELYGNDVAHNTFYYQGIITGAEEGLEMLGGIIIFYVIMNHLDTHYRLQLRRAWQHLVPKKASGTDG